MQVGELQVREEATRLHLVVAVDEGPRAKLSAVRFEGATLPDAELRAAAALESGRPYDEAAVSAAAARVRGHYLALGYAEAQVKPQPQVDGHDVVLVLEVTEGQRRVVSSVELSGNTRTRDWLVRRGLDLPAGTPLDPALLAAAERRLIDLGVFSRVALVPRDEDPSAQVLELEEGPRFVGGYDLRWDTTEGTSALVDGEARNVLGLGLSVGGRYRYGADHREARATLRLPAALAGGEIVGSLYRLEDDFQGGDASITSRQQGFQIQESLRLPGRVDVLAGYRFRRNTTLAQGLSAEPIDVAGLDVSVLRNTRDDLLDPRRGEFLSLNLEIAPALLGSDAPVRQGLRPGSARALVGKRLLHLGAELPARARLGIRGRARDRVRTLPRRRSEQPSRLRHERGRSRATSWATPREARPCWSSIRSSGTGTAPAWAASSSTTGATSSHASRISASSCDTRSARACAGHHPSACCAWTWGCRSTGSPTRRATRSSSASARPSSSASPGL